MRAAWIGGALGAAALAAGLARATGAPSAPEFRGCSYGIRQFSDRQARVRSPHGQPRQATGRTLPRASRLSHRPPDRRHPRVARLGHPYGLLPPGRAGAGCGGGAENVGLSPGHLHDRFRRGFGEAGRWRVTGGWPALSWRRSAGVCLGDGQAEAGGVSVAAQQERTARRCDWVLRVSLR